MRTFYITGIAGFLGRNILLELEQNEKDYQVIGFVLPQEKKLDYLQNDKITLVEGNILSREDVDKFLSTPGKGEKIIIHAAGRVSTFKKHDDLTIKINYQGTKNIVDSLNTINNFNKFVYISSVDSLPKTKGKEDIFEIDYYDENKVDGVYSKSKALANNYIIDNLHIPFNIVLPSAMIGSNDPYHSPINNAIDKFIKDKLPAITKGGYDIVDVRDVAKGILSIIEKGKPNNSYLLTGHYTSVKDLILLASKITNKKPVRLLVPHFFIKIISPFIELYARIKRKTPLFTGFSMDCLMQNSNYNYKKASEDLYYNPRSLEESIKDTINYLQDNPR